MEGLRSQVWSSETLREGMASVAKQPGTILAKTESEADLLEELKDTWICLACLLQTLFQTQWGCLVK